MLKIRSFLVALVASSIAFTGICSALVAEEAPCQQQETDEVCDNSDETEVAPAVGFRFGNYWQDDENPVQQFDYDTNWPGAREDSFYDELTR